MDSYEWLAGLLEGEGSFLKGVPSNPGKPRVVLGMTDEDVVKRAATLLGVNQVWKQKYRNPAWKPYYRFQVSGQRAVDLMIRIRPLMGARRRAQIDAAVACWNPRSEKYRERNEEIVRRHATGESYAAIARAMGLSRQSVRGVAARHVNTQRRLGCIAQG